MFWMFTDCLQEFKDRKMLGNINYNSGCMNYVHTIPTDNNYKKTLDVSTSFYISLKNGRNIYCLNLSKIKLI